MQQPFAVNQNTSMASLQTLFNLLFTNKADITTVNFENATGQQILSVLKNGQIGINLTDEGAIICFAKNGVLYQNKPSPNGFSEYASAHRVQLNADTVIDMSDKKVPYYVLIQGHSDGDHLSSVTIFINDIITTHIAGYNQDYYAMSYILNPGNVKLRMEKSTYAIVEGFYAPLYAEE